MKIMMIEGSPKVGESNSKYFLENLNKLIESDQIVSYKLTKCQHYENIVNDILTIDTLVIGFPLYVDSIPSHLLRFMIFLEEEFKDRLSNVKVYIIANCGFYEGKQNSIALKLTKAWCKRTGLVWGQGIGIGAGEMMGELKNIPIDKGPNKSLGLALKSLAKNINESNSGEDIFTEPSGFPKIIFRVAANNFWVSKAKQNGLTKKDLDKCIVK